MHALNNVPTVIENPPDILCVHGTREVRVAVVPSISTCCADSLCKARERHWVKKKPTGEPPPRTPKLDWRGDVRVWALSSKSATEWQNAHKFSVSHLKHGIQNDQNYMVRRSLQAGEFQRGMRTQEDAIMVDLATQLLVRLVMKKVGFCFPIQGFYPLLSHLQKAFVNFLFYSILKWVHNLIARLTITSNCSNIKKKKSMSIIASAGH